MITGEKPIANPMVVFREEFDDWAVLFNPDTGGAVGINPVGVAIWKLMNGERNLEEITTHVKEEFNDVPETVDEEVTDFVANLVESGFVGYELKEFDK